MDRFVLFTIDLRGIIFVCLVLIWQSFLTIGFSYAEEDKPVPVEAENIIKYITEPKDESESSKINELIKKLGDEKWAIREKATEDLINIGEPVLASVQKALKYRDPEIRLRARFITKEIELNMFFSKKGNILILNNSGGWVFEINKSGEIVWQKTGLSNPHDVDRLSNGHTLITERGRHRIIEVDKKGEIVWSYDQLDDPVAAERLQNGNTLIAALADGFIIEVDQAGKEVWKFEGLQSPVEADRLKNGHTLICEIGRGRVIEVTPNKEIVWQKEGIGYPGDADRLANGHTLIADTAASKVIEVDKAGKIVWEIDAGEPYDADRVAEGMTLIIDRGNSRVMLVNQAKEVIWQKSDVGFLLEVEMVK